MTSIEKTFLSAIRSVASLKDELHLHAPIFGDLEKSCLIDCIDSGWVSSAGPYLDKFEYNLTEFTGAKHAICCVNATAGIHAALLGLGVKALDEVLVPAFSFAATANAVCHVNATPHFVDISPETLGVDAKCLEKYLENTIFFKNDVPYNRQTDKKIAALIVVHCFGYPAHMDEILAVCKKYNIPIIEDAAEGLGSYYKGKHVGNFGVVSVLSFNGNKIITTGGGGAILTNDSNLACKIRHLITTAKQPHPWEYNHDMVGYNYRLPNLNAALGVAQLQKLPEFLVKKKKLHEKYKKAFLNSNQFVLLTDYVHTQSNHWLNTIILSNASDQKSILELAHQNKIYIRPIWKMLSKQEYLKKCPKMNLANAENLEHRIINIPSSSFLINED